MFDGAGDIIDNGGGKVEYDMVGDSVRDGAADSVSPAPIPHCAGATSAATTSKTVVACHFLPFSAHTNNLLLELKRVNEAQSECMRNAIACARTVRCVQRSKLVNQRISAWHSAGTLRGAIRTERVV